MKFNKTIASFVFGLIAISATAQTQVIAHRGFWKTDGSAQNSITALRKAAEAKVYGSEFDVQMTADGIVVVNHDNTIGGKTIADTNYADIKDEKLSNGENLSLLTDYLDEGKKHKDMLLILEIKRQPTTDADDKITRKVVEMVKEKGLENQVEYISFGLNICELLKKLVPESTIYYLNGDLTPQDVSAKGFSGIDYEYNVLKKNPQWISEAHAAGMKVNGWTVNKEDEIRELISLGVDFITTNEPLLVQQLIDEAK